MIALLDTPIDLKEAERDLGCKVNQLLTPASRRRVQYPDQPFAIDNGAYSGFKEREFRNLLRSHYAARDRCIFVCVPDVVGSARRTLECFEFWSKKLRGWPLALVAQDGQEHLPIPWKQIKAIFIGGTTDWKVGRSAEQIIRAAQIMGKYVHAGRVNTPGRWKHFEELGADSIDGTGLAKFTWMRQDIYDRDNQPHLPHLIEAAG